MTLGFYDTSKFKGELQWYPVEDKYGYGIRLQDIKVKGQDLNICEGKSNCLLTIDSGSSAIAFPEWGVEKMLSKGYPAGGSSVSCSSPSDLGDLIFVIDGRDYIVPNSDWVSQGSSLAQSKVGPLGP